jgi:hypothetical protein
LKVHYPGIPFRLIFVLAACIAGGHISAQDYSGQSSKKAVDFFNRGLQQYTYRNFVNAEKLLEEAIKTDSLFLDARFLLAQVEEDRGQPQLAISAYRKALAINEMYYPAGYIKLGTLLYKDGQYEQGLAAYNRFLALKIHDFKNETIATDGVARCRFAIYALQHPVDFRPENLGPAVNSKADDYWPSLSADEHTLVITRLIRSEDLMRDVQEDFFISHWENNEWTPMKNMGFPINTGDNEGAQTLSADGRLMIFTACNRADGLGKCDLYWCTRQGDTWTQPKNMGKPVNSAYRETQPSVSPDGRTLYFSSDRPGGKGNHDIWVTHKDSSDRWTVPVNLGDSINTKGTEMSPFIHPDNRSLYFSSDGFPGMGGFDLFVSRRNPDGSWGKAKNLGYPINTNKDEIGLIVNARGDKAYFSSNVHADQGRDIFTFDMPVADRPMMTTYMKGKVMDAVDSRLLRARFELTDLETGRNFYTSYSDSLTGEFVVSIPVNHNFMLNVSKKGYLFYSANFTLKGIFEREKPYLMDVPLQPVSIGKSIVLNNVFYETDSYALKKESESELKKVVEFLRLNPGIRIEISGYTDNSGGADYNQKLSENRARSVADYIISNHIDPARISSKGYGESNPVATNETQEGKAQNRRTGLKIIQ